MSSVGDKYILPGRDDHDRLRMISEIHDARTQALLKRAGLSAQGHFVEFGCGLGYVTRWAAAEGAHATGIDVNEDQILACQTLAQEAGLGHASFRVGSVYEPGIEPNTLDICYSRWLMVHLNRRVEAMREIALKAGLARGVNYSGGRWAHTWAKEAGFDIVHADAYHPHYLEGPHKGFWNWTLRNACRRLVEEGAMTEARWTELVDGMTQADNSRDTLVAHCRMHQLIARKPTSLDSSREGCPPKLAENSGRSTPFQSVRRTRGTCDPTCRRQRPTQHGRHQRLVAQA